MGPMSDYLFEYDDPYKLLAAQIVGGCRPADVLRILSEDAYILNLITKETRSQDMCGMFTDCIVEDILARKDRMEYMRRLDILSGYYFSKLDKERLRAEIKNLLDEAGIEVDYSTAGNVSSESA